MRTVAFVCKRIGRLLLTILVISSVAFFIVRIIPGDPASFIAGIDASAEDVAAIRARLGIDVPLYTQYFNWLQQILRFDFGRSLISSRAVSSLILERFPLTLTIAVLGVVISLVLAVPLGVISAVRRGSFWDYLGMLVSQVGMAIPSFWLGILLLLLLAVKIQLFPLFGSGSIRHLILPALSLGIARAAVLLRLTRASMSEELQKEYVVAARSKGLTESMVRYKHALKNALLPLMTMAGIQFGYMLGGSIIIEQVFSLPGLGRLFLTGIYQRDFPLVQGGVVFVAICFSLVNALVDILYGVVNPKIRIT